MAPSQWPARVLSIVLLSVGLFITLCLITYDPADVGLLSSSRAVPSSNLGGALGGWIGFIGRGGFGWASLLIPIICVLWAQRLWKGKRPSIHGISFIIGCLCLLASVATLQAMRGADALAQTQMGGVVGMLLASSGSYYLGVAGTLLTSVCVGILAWVVVSGETGPWPFKGLQKVFRGLAGKLRGLLSGTGEQSPSSTAASEVRTPSVLHPETAGKAAAPKLAHSWSRGPTQKERASSTAQPTGAAEVRIRQAALPKLKSSVVPARRMPPVSGDFQLPPLDLLKTPPPVSAHEITEHLQVNAKILQDTLRDFGIEASVVNIDRGPTVTRFELTPASGVKLTRIVSLADEIALVLKTASCHVVAPIPGRGTVGIDVPNTTTAMVHLKEILESAAFTSACSPLTLPIGKDVSGSSVVADLRECPHLLIAGATGSGKTVCLNSLLVGMMTHSTPAQVKFLMIDPKMVELSMFNNIPNLVAPVMTNAKKAAAALNWTVLEMERRYNLFSDKGVRNIDMYNRRIVSERPSPKAAPLNAQGEEVARAPLPYIVIVIDELADLMMISAQDVEHAVTRLAQLSRAVGIHIILATQRPSVDVITGVIKANFPARIAFQVSSKVDSRTILDANGADKLLGRGDLLFLQPGAAKPLRAQGAFVADTEIERITSFLKQHGEPSYDADLIESQRRREMAGFAGKDEMYEAAKRLVIDTGQASTSLLQRRLRLGYGRAARILDVMEQEGLVGPPQGSRPREVLAGQDAPTQD